MLRRDDRLTLPAFGEGGDWIVKLPDPVFADVPRNEQAMMTLAGLSGITVPEHRLVSRGELDGLPSSAWLSDEDVAYAVRRFDRGETTRDLIHIEDFAQVRNILPYGNNKYQGNFETVGALIFRRRDVSDLVEFVRRLAFNAVISNGDAHLKNWSLIYTDPRSPRLSPAYDLVSTTFYAENLGRDNFGLKFDGSRRYERVSLGGFKRLGERIGAAGAQLPEVAEHTILLANDNWPRIADTLSANPRLQDSVAHSLDVRTRSILGN
jgi:serine/threonine-protein kinase HipA